MASSNENQNARYHSPDKTLASPGRPIRSNTFAIDIPSTPQNQNRPNRSISPPPVFANALLREQRRQHFQKNFRRATNRTTTTTTVTTATSRCHGLQTFLLYAVIVFSVLFIFALPSVFYSVFGPRAPNFAIEQITVYSPPGVATAFNITFKVNNPSRHVGVFYEDYSSVSAFYSGNHVCSGGFPPFYQPPLGETRLQSLLAALAVVPPEDVKVKLKNDTNNKRIPLSFNMMSMVRFKMGKLTHRAVVKVYCEITLLDLLRTYPSEKLSGSCESTGSFWFPVVLNGS